MRKYMKIFMFLVLFNSVNLFAWDSLNSWRYRSEFNPLDPARLEALLEFDAKHYPEDEGLCYEFSIREQWHNFYLFFKKFRSISDDLSEIKFAEETEERLSKLFKIINDMMGHIMMSMDERELFDQADAYGLLVATQSLNAENFDVYGRRIIRDAIFNLISDKKTRNFLNSPKIKSHNEILVAAAPQESFIEQDSEIKPIVSKPKSKSKKGNGIKISCFR